MLHRIAVVVAQFLILAARYDVGIVEALDALGVGKIAVLVRVGRNAVRHEELTAAVIGVDIHVERAVDGICVGRGIVSDLIAGIVAVAVIRRLLADRLLFLLRFLFLLALRRVIVNVVVIVALGESRA